jgi:hypothetical protein
MIPSVRHHHLTRRDINYVQNAVSPFLKRDKRANIRTTIVMHEDARMDWKDEISPEALRWATEQYQKLFTDWRDQRGPDAVPGTMELAAMTIRSIAAAREEGRRAVYNEAIILAMPGDKMYPERRQAIMETLDEL